MTIVSRRAIPVFCVLPLLVAGSPLTAQIETTNYTYDVRGRVVEVESVLGSDTVSFDYTYDRADNRTRQVIEEQSTTATPPTTSIEADPSEAPQR